MQMAGITKQQGVPCSVLLLYLLLIRILEVSVFRFYKAKCYGLHDEGIGKNCFYRFLTNASYNWRGLLLGVAKQFLRIVERRGGESASTLDFYIVDDTTLEKTGRHFEGLSRVHDHTSGRHVLGYKMLPLSYFDGKSTIDHGCTVQTDAGRLDGTHPVAAYTATHRPSHVQAQPTPRADFEQTMHTLQAGGQEADEIMRYISIQATVPIRE